MIKFKQL